VLGAQPLLGSVFTEEEDTRGVRVAVISYGLWQRRFGGSQDVLGRKIILNDTSYEVIGIMPREFYFMPARDIDVWMPTAWSAEHLTQWWWHDVHCVARLKPGVTLQQARESMAALSLRVSEQHVKPPRAAVVTPLREELAGVGVFRADRYRRCIDVWTCARSRLVAARLAGRTARRRPRQFWRAQPSVPTFAHHHRDGSRRRAADERRIAAADVSTSAAA